MKAMVCEMCQSNDLVKQDGMYVCQCCGTKYSVEEARKLLVEGVVKIDTSDELRNLYELARRAKNEGDSVNAQRYYEQAIIKDPSNWEATFYTTYYQSINCKLGEIGIAAVRVANNEETVYRLINNNVIDPAKQREAVDEVAARLIEISSLLFYAYKDYYDDIDEEIQSEYMQEYADNCSACRDVAYHAGDVIVAVFGDKYGDIAAECWKLGVIQHNVLNGVYKDKKGHAAIINSYNDKIMRYDSTYQAPKTNMRQDGGCYIATAVYGSYDCPQVWTLRRYRDNTLASAWYGRVFVRTYYAISPSLVKWFGQNEWFKKFWKSKLDKMVNKLQSSGFESTPYEDITW